MIIIRVGKKVSSLENIPDILILIPLGHSNDKAPEKIILQVESHFFILCVSILVLFQRIVIIINSLKSKSTDPLMFHDDCFLSNFHRILDLQLHDHILCFFTSILLNKEPPSLILSNSNGRSFFFFKWEQHSEVLHNITYHKRRKGNHKGSSILRDILIFLKSAGRAL